MILWVLPVSLLAQAPTAITLDEEAHHHLVLKNNAVKVFEIDLAPRDALLMHRHDQDEISVVFGAATTVSTTPGQADILTISKAGDIGFTRGGWVHSVRNIGQTAFHSVLIDLQRTQTGARNMCGAQVKDTPANCPATAANATRADVPQFETDQVRVTLTRIRPRQQAIFGEPDRDDLIIAIDEAVVTNQKMPPGGTIWIARGGARRVIKNNSEKEISVVSVAFKP
jgi:quercetin dioxygenase-like cupin family protein